MKHDFYLLRGLAIVIASLLCVFGAFAGNQIGNKARFGNSIVNGYCGLAGDVNHDGAVAVNDVTTMIDNILNDCECDVFMDMDDDGCLTIKDVIVMVDDVITGRPPKPIYAAYGVTFKLVRVQGGTFSMGGTSEQGNGVNADELPVHQVTLSDFYIGQTEVTQDLWEAVMQEWPSGSTQNLRCPVEMVSWNECMAFISKLNALTGLTFRLPTEAEWEFAARGGIKSKGYMYSGSNDFNDVAWSEDNSGDVTHVVGSKMCNELGLYDMSGNVWEWCQDWFGNYSDSSQIDPTGPETGTERIVRGGCMRGHTRFCRVSYRMNYTSATQRIDVGLRLAM